MKTDFFNEEHEYFRDLVHTFALQEIAPFYKTWEKEHNIPRTAWKAAGQKGLLGLSIPEKYNGLAISDYRYRMIIDQELIKFNAPSVALNFHLNDDLVLPYIINLGTEDQKYKLLPGMTQGSIIASHGFTEPEAGSDLKSIRTTAIKSGQNYIINGQKIFIGNGKNSDIVIVLAKTEEGPTLFIVERGIEGFTSGKPYSKISLMASDTTPMTFKDVKVSKHNILGKLGKGMLYASRYYIQARLAIATAASVVSEVALEITKQYVKNRKQFGNNISDFQNTRFTLANLQAKFSGARSLLEDSIIRYNSNNLTSSEAAQIKLLSSQVNAEIVDKCLQLHGGYGFISEYQISQLYLISRIMPIFGGTNEIMKEIIAKDIFK